MTFSRGAGSGQRVDCCADDRKDSNPQQHARANRESQGREHGPAPETTRAAARSNDLRLRRCDLGLWRHKVQNSPQIGS